jgi:transposase
MKRTPKQAYTAAFKEQAVGMVKSGKGVPEVTRAPGLAEQTLRERVKAAAQAKLQEGAKEVTPGQMERSRLRAENSRLKREVEILSSRWRCAARSIRCCSACSARAMAPVRRPGQREAGSRRRSWVRARLELRETGRWAYAPVRDS